MSDGTELGIYWNSAGEPYSFWPIGIDGDIHNSRGKIKLHRIYKKGGDDGPGRAHGQPATLPAVCFFVR